MVYFPAQIMMIIIVVTVMMIITVLMMRVIHGGNNKRSVARSQLSNHGRMACKYINKWLLLMGNAMIYFNEGKSTYTYNLGSLISVIV